MNQFLWFRKRNIYKRNVYKEIKNSIIKDHKNKYHDDLEVRICSFEKIVSKYSIIKEKIKSQANSGIFIHRSHPSAKRGDLIWVKEELSDKRTIVVLLHECGHFMDYIDYKNGRGYYLDFEKRRPATASYNQIKIEKGETIEQRDEYVKKEARRQEYEAHKYVIEYIIDKNWEIGEDLRKDFKCFLKYMDGGNSYAAKVAHQILEDYSDFFDNFPPSSL